MVAFILEFVKTQLEPYEFPEEILAEFNQIPDIMVLMADFEYMVSLLRNAFIGQDEDITPLQQLISIDNTRDNIFEELSLGYKGAFAPHWHNGNLAQKNYETINTQRDYSTEADSLCKYGFLDNEYLGSIKTALKMKLEFLT